MKKKTEEDISQLNGTSMGAVGADRKNLCNHLRVVFCTFGVFFQ
jgi:hypothetical protein